MNALEALGDHALTAGLETRRSPELAQAARDFEALLMGTLLKNSTRPIGGRALLDGGSAGRMYREMFYQELARHATQQGGFGIAQLLETLPGQAASGEQP